MDDKEVEEQSGTSAEWGYWVQINNTVVPVLKRSIPGEEDTLLVPLPVIRHGAGLLTEAEPDTIKCSDEESNFMSKLCSDAGFKFDFPRNTDLILLDDVSKYHKEAVRVVKLPDRDPFTHASFWSDKPLSCTDTTNEQSVDEKNKIGSESNENSNELPSDGQKDDISLTHNREERIKDDNSPNECKTQQAPIWRPFSFSSEKDNKDNDNSDASTSDPDQPLDLSAPTKKMKSDEESKNETVQASQVPVRHGISARHQYLMGKQVMVIVNHSTEYVPLDVLHCAFFAHIPVYSFLDIIAAANTPLVDVTSVHSTSLDNINQLFTTSTKMVAFKDAENTLLRVGIFLDAMASYQIEQMLSMNFYMQNMYPDVIPGISQPQMYPGAIMGAQIRQTRDDPDKTPKIANGESKKDEKITSGIGSPGQRRVKRKRLLDTVEKIQKKQTSTDTS